jgi:radical SAM-linked protein
MNDVAPVRHRYDLRFAVTGRIRFLSHLEMVDTLLAAFRRSGVQLAMSQGMRPKPLIKVAMPRPVGVEAWDDIVEVQLTSPIDPDSWALALQNTLPEGLQLQSVNVLPADHTSAASRVAGATFRLVVTGASTAELDSAAAALMAAETLPITRTSPKRTRHVDVRPALGDIVVLDTGTPGTVAVRFTTKLTESGSARPAEVVEVLATQAGRPIDIERIVRESIHLAATSAGGTTAVPALVGADVPDGPAKPWGAC